MAAENRKHATPSKRIFFLFLGQLHSETLPSSFFSTKLLVLHLKLKSRFVNFEVKNQNFNAQINLILQRTG